MTAFPSLSRVTESSINGGLQSQLQRRLQALATEEQRISTGLKHQSLADAPLVTRRLVSMTRQVERAEKFETNIQFADSRLAASESALDEIGNLIQRAREIALGQINATATDETRVNASVEVSFLIDEIVALGNRQFGERYLFGGSEVESPPFARVGEYVAYRGNDQQSRVEISAGVFHADSISGVEAFGAFSSEIRGRVDLDPLVDMGTSLSRINGGNGFAGGVIEIRDGVDREFVDLSGVKTVGDVVDRINASGFATAAIDAAGGSIEITKAGANLSILDVNGGFAATSLGLNQLSQGASLVGHDLDPTVVLTTPLADLRGGLGITDGTFEIQNGTLQATIDTTGLTTVEDLLNAIARSGTETFARINADGSGIDLISTLSGADFTVTDGGSGTAGELGLEIPSGDVPIGRLNGGRGIQTLDGDDIRVTLADGTTIEVDADAAKNLGEIAALFNDDPNNGGLLLAEVVAGEDRLRLTDLSGGAGTMQVDPVNGSFAASSLGLLVDPVAGVVEGEDLSPGALRVDSVFEGFSLLHQGLTASDEPLLARAIQALDRAEETVLQARAEIGTGVRRLEISQRRIEIETLQLETQISLEGDTDLAATILAFQREETVLQASLNTGSRILQQSLLDFLV